MSLLATVNQPTTGQYYFALAGAPTPPAGVVSAEGFVATGGAVAGPVGTFTSVGDASLGGSVSLWMKRPAPSGANQWGVGMGGVPTGSGNVGNNFAIYSYDDSGNFLDAPLVINRATGATETGDLTVAGNLTVTGTITPMPVSGGWTDFFAETTVPLELEESSNTPIFTIPLPPAMQNATKYTVRVFDINIPVIQSSTLGRALVYFDYNPARNGISYISGGVGESSGCDNNFIWLGNATGGTGGKLQSGTSFTNPGTGPLNAPIAPFSNNAFFADSGASPTASLASLNLPVFNIFNYNGDTGITNLYCVFNPDPNNGTQVVGQMGAGARLRCVVEASFAPKY